MKQIKFFTLTLMVLFIGTVMANAQTPAQNKETAKKIIAAVDAGDLNTFSMYVNPALIEHMPPPPGAPKASSDFELSKMLISGFHSSFPDAKSTILHMTAEGDLVTIHSRYTATNKGPIMGMPATNKAVDIEQVDIIRFDASGKGIEHWAVIDQLTMLQQLGVIPADGK